MESAAAVEELEEEWCCCLPVNLGCWRRIRHDALGGLTGREV